MLRRSVPRNIYSRWGENDAGERRSAGRKKGKVVLLFSLLSLLAAQTQGEYFLTADND
jgi:hypothetical protein